MARLIHPEDGAVIALHTAQQAGFMGAGTAEAIDWLNIKRSGGEDCTFPNEMEFIWESGSGSNVLELATDADFTDARRIIAHGDSASVGNLLSGQEYFWRVNGGEARSFITFDAAPRWLHAEGISNVRDMGAWRNVDGRRVRQGLIFRGSEMDTHHTITEKGVAVMKNQLGIRTDLDIRGEAMGKVTESPLGKDVEFLLIPAKAYAEFMDDDQKPVCKKLFEVLADETKYPIYFHCWGGADRTGTLALMLESVLGLSDEDMLRDYELTSLSVWGERSRRSDLFISLMEALEKYPGGSIRERAINYLRSCGIAVETMERIRKNLIE